MNTTIATDNRQATKPQTIEKLDHRNPEVLRAATPIFIAGFGVIVALGVLVVVLFGQAHSSQLEPTVATTGFGVASTALAGAVGLAQASKNDKEEDKN